MKFLTQYIFCWSRRDDSIGGIESEFFYPEYLEKFWNFEKKIEQEARRLSSIVGPNASIKTIFVSYKSFWKVLSKWDWLVLSAWGFQLFPNFQNVFLNVLDYRIFS